MAEKYKKFRILVYKRKIFTIYNTEAQKFFSLKKNSNKQNKMEVFERTPRKA